MNCFFLVEEVEIVESSAWEQGILQTRKVIFCLRPVGIKNNNGFSLNRIVLGAAVEKPY